MRVNLPVAQATVETGAMTTPSRRLILIRHSKAAEGPVDIERDLAPRGRKDALAIGEFLLKIDAVPQQAVVSPATRALNTWHIAQSVLTTAVEEIIDERIYDNDVDLLLDVIRETRADISSVALVGHNPSFAELAHTLDDGRGDGAASRQMHDGYPTSGTAVFECAPDWADVAADSGTLRFFAAPRARH
jgi:phosphohistidine phosphatase